MAHFAKIENGIVTEVLVIEQDVIDTGLFGDPALWVQTSYNTYGGQHPEGRGRAHERAKHDQTILNWLIIVQVPCHLLLPFLVRSPTVVGMSILCHHAKVALH